MPSDEAAHTLRMPGAGATLMRSRLLAPMERLRPPSVFLIAPSGYGKSVLAGQLAGSELFDRALWMPRAELGGLEGTLTALADGLRRYSPRSDRTCLGLPGPADVMAMVEDGLSALPSRTCLVLDDLSWVPSGSDTYVAQRLAAALPPGSCLIVTSRLSGWSSIPSQDAWVLGVEDLRLDNAEACSLARMLLDQGACTEVETAVVRLSGGQPALLSVLARDIAVAQQAAAAPVRANGELHRLISDWANAQLSDGDRLMLNAVALLGHGTLGELAAVVPDGHPLGRLRTISREMPLVRLVRNEVADVDEFHVHEFARHIMLDPATFAREFPRAWSSGLECLHRRGEASRVIALCLRADSQIDLEHWLDVSGGDLVARCEYDLVQRGLAALSTARLVSCPRLLLLKSICQWELGEVADALGAARIAKDLAEQQDDLGLLADATILLARIRAGVGDCAGARANLRPLLDCRARLGWSTRATALAYGVLAAAFLGEWHEYEALDGAAQRIQVGRAVEPDVRGLLLVCRGLAAGFATGDWARSITMFEAAHDAVGASQGTRLAGQANQAAALIETGRLARACRVNDQVLKMAEQHGLLGTSYSAESVRALLDLSNGSPEGQTDALERCIEGSMGLGDSLTAAISCAIGSAALRGAGQPERALSLCDRAMSVMDSMTVPTLTTLTRLERASVLAQMGDGECARTCATTIHEDVALTGARHLHLKADLILAEADCRDGLSGAATGRLGEHVGYILTESANWQIAMHVRAYPPLFGAIVAAVGGSQMPVHLLKMIPPAVADEALAATHEALSPAEYSAIASRLGGVHGGRSRRAADRAPSGVCSVKLFGGLHVSVSGRVVEDREWRKRKARLLFGMLATRCGKDVPRDHLLEYLWPEMEEDQALNNLYVVWSSMKHALTPNLGRGQACPYVEHRGGVCRAIAGRVTTDLDEFERHRAAAAKARTLGRGETELAALLSAAELYTGELLPGEVYDDWFASLRERCRHDFEDTTLRAATLLDERGDAATGLSLLRRALQQDPWREDLYQATLRLQIAASQRSAAIETYFACRTRLVEDLGIDPSKETTRLYEQVLCMEENSGPDGTGRLDAAYPRVRNG